MDSGDRDTWTFPGDRYEHQACSWVRIDGPRKACTRAENLEAITMVLRVLERMGNSGPIPIGACPRHPGGCGRSGRLELARIPSPRGLGEEIAQQLDQPADQLAHS